MGPSKDKLTFDEEITDDWVILAAGLGRRCGERGPPAAGTDSVL